MKHLNSFYSHAKKEIDDFIANADYSTFVKAKGEITQLLGSFQELPEEVRQQIQQSVIDKIKSHYEVTPDSVQKCELGDVRLVHDLAVAGKDDILEQHYSIKRKKGVQGNPKPYGRALQIPTYSKQAD